MPFVTKTIVLILLQVCWRGFPNWYFFTHTDKPASFSTDWVPSLTLPQPANQAPHLGPQKYSHQLK